MKINKVEKIEDGIYKITSNDKLNYMVDVLSSVPEFNETLRDGGTFKVETADVDFYLELNNTARLLVEPEKKIYVEAMLITFAYGDVKRFLDEK